MLLFFLFYLEYGINKCKNKDFNINNKHFER